MIRLELLATALQLSNQIEIIAEVFLLAIWAALRLNDMQMCKIKKIDKKVLYGAMHIDKSKKLRRIVGLEVVEITTPLKTISGKNGGNHCLRFLLVKDCY